MILISQALFRDCICQDHHLRYRKYGVSRFELSTIPGVIGHRLAGRVRATLDLQPAEGFRVALTCLRRITTRSGKSSSTSETILWQDERRVQGEQSRDYTGMGINIPVSFALPPDAVASDASNPSNRVLWRLEISASLPGVDYDSTFEVPVFRTAASEQPASAEERAGSETSLAAFHQAASSRIAVTTRGGRTEILFPAARNLGAAAGLTVFTLIWWGTVGIQLYLHAPIIFPIVTAAFGLLLLVGAFDLWLKVSRVTVGAGTRDPGQWVPLSRPGTQPCRRRDRRSDGGYGHAAGHDSVLQRGDPAQGWEETDRRQLGARQARSRVAGGHHQDRGRTLTRRRGQVPAGHDRTQVLGRRVDVDEIFPALGVGERDDRTTKLPGHCFPP